MRERDVEGEVQRYYERSVVQEWERFTKDPLRVMEFKTTIKYLKKYLPRDGVVLDAGCGPGMYSLAMAKKGHDVVMLDLTAANLKFARRQIGLAKPKGRVRKAVQGQIEDLSAFKDGTFDGVVCLGGPLSHVLDRRARERAARELVRVAKPGAPIFVSVMNRLSFTIGLVKAFQDEIDSPYLKAAIRSGDYLGGLGFVPFHAFLPEELEELFRRQGVDVIGGVGLEGFGVHTEDEIRDIYRARRTWRQWVNSHNKFMRKASDVGASNHMLIICRKP